MSRRISYEAFNKSLTKDEFEELVSSAGYSICRGFRLVRISIRNKETKSRRIEHIGYKASWKVFWNNLSFKHRVAVRRMPFFDEKVFFEITGIQLRSGKRMENENGNEKYDLFHGGTSKKEYAAIKLKIPRSGNPELDAWIRKSRMTDFARDAVLGVTYSYFRDEHPKADMSQIANCAYIIAGRMMERLEKEGWGKK
jgi:hypothetical protein